MRLAVCLPQVPFERGGAEIFADDLVEQLRARDHEASLVTVPFKWYPGERVLTQAFLWRLLDLEEANGRPVDAVIATKFPSYVVRHPRKVVWLLHQFRQAWDFDRTALGQFSESAEDRALRRRVLELERTALSEARAIFATSRNVAGRLRDSVGLDAELMPHPPASLPFRCDGYEDFILSVNRLDRAVDRQQELAPHRLEVDCVPQPHGERRHDRLGVVARAVEAPIDEPLHAEP